MHNNKLPNRKTQDRLSACFFIGRLEAYPTKGTSVQRRKIQVDMSSKAIDARISEVSQLRKLGLSIAKAKPIAKPTNSTIQNEACPESEVEQLASIVLPLRPNIE